MALKRNEFIPQSILTVYSSPSGMTDPRTGYAYAWGGLMVGDFFDLTTAEAQALSGGQCYEGRYRFVQIDSGATYSKIVQGSIGLMKSLALGVNVITDYDAGLGAGLHPVVFLAPVTASQITAGAYVFVQEMGDATLLAGNSITAPAGTAVMSQTGGTVTNGSTAPAQIGVAAASASTNTKFRALLTLVAQQG